MTYRRESNTESFGHHRPSRSQESGHKIQSEESVQRSTRCDGSRHSVLETLGQTQSGGDDGDGVGCVEFSCSNTKAWGETKYPGEQTVGVTIEYNAV